MATKKYESMRIMSLEGSVLYKNEGFSATKNGKPDPKAFRGVLDESLDTLKLAEVYDRHKSELAYPYLDGKKRFCRAVVSLSFNRAIKLYESLRQPLRSERPQRYRRGYAGSRLHQHRRRQADADRHRHILPGEQWICTRGETDCGRNPRQVFQI